MTAGKTVLIIKGRSKGAVPSNYRLITCLPTIWKLLTSILSNALYKHLLQGNILPYEQKGCTRGVKDQLLIDSMVMNEAKKRHKNLQMVWVDYRKAYDSVPHSWILECLEMMKAHHSLCKFMKCSMQLWKTDLTI